MWSYEIRVSCDQIVTNISSSIQRARWTQNPVPGDRGEGSIPSSGTLLKPYKSASYEAFRACPFSPIHSWSMEPKYPKNP